MAEAQRQMRSIFAGGSVGAIVAGLVWLLSAVAATTAGIGWGVLVMIATGFFIYPLTQLALRAMGGRGTVPPENPLRELSVEVPLVGPLMIPLVGAAALHRVEWFYPAMMLAMGAHYIPFSFLYGMPQFVRLGIVMSVGGVAVGLWAPGLSKFAAFLTAGVLFGFALIAYQVFQRENRALG